MVKYFLILLFLCLPLASLSVETKDYYAELMKQQKKSDEAGQEYIFSLSLDESLIFWDQFLDKEFEKANDADKLGVVTGVCMFLAGAVQKEGGFTQENTGKLITILEDKDKHEAFKVAIVEIISSKECIKQYIDEKSKENGKGKANKAEKDIFDFLNDEILASKGVNINKARVCGGLSNALSYIMDVELPKHPEQKKKQEIVNDLVSQNMDRLTEILLDKELPFEYFLNALNGLVLYLHINNPAGKEALANKLKDLEKTLKEIYLNRESYQEETMYFIETKLEQDFDKEKYLLRKKTNIIFPRRLKNLEEMLKKGESIDNYAKEIPRDLFISGLAGASQSDDSNIRFNAMGYLLIGEVSSGKQIIPFVQSLLPKMMAPDGKIIDSHGGDEVWRLVKLISKNPDINSIPILCQIARGHPSGGDSKGLMNDYGWDKDIGDHKWLIDDIGNAIEKCSNYKIGKIPLKLNSSMAKEIDELITGWEKWYEENKGTEEKSK